MSIRLPIVIMLLMQISPAQAFEWADLWFTPDQQGQRLMEQGKYQQAAGAVHGWRL